MTLRAALAAALCAAVAAGCGSDSDGAAPAKKRAPSDRLVDFGKEPPYVNDLGVDPANGDFLLTTNRGFFRIDPETDKVTPVRGTVTAAGRSSPVGTFLSFTPTGGKTLLGSGHPDQEGALPSFLGLLRSDDMGATWQVLSRLGEADLHKITKRGDRIYAYDAVLSAMLISRNGGRTFAERFTPRGQVIDFVVDPRDEKVLVAATEDQLFRSEDEGRGWRPLGEGDGTRLVWPRTDRLLRADRDGTVQVSADGGTSWRRLARVAGEPYKFLALEGTALLLALSDGTIMTTSDGGTTWEIAFEP